MESLIRYLCERLKRTNHTALNDEYAQLLDHDGENPPYLDEESADDGNETDLKFEYRQDQEYKTEESIGDMKELSRRFPESAARETPLHLAVRHGNCNLVKLLLENLRLKNFHEDVINLKDCCGDTALHLATSTKQLKTLELLLEHSPSMMEVNAKNKCGLTALDMVDFLTQEGEIEMEIRKILGRAGAMRSKDIVNEKTDNKNHEVHIELGKESSQKQATRSESQTNRYHGLLLLATLIATITFQAALRSPAIFEESTNNFFPIENQESEMNHLFILFNSFAFFSSLALITLLTYGLPLKPWLPIVVFAAIGAYICIIMATSPHEVVTVLYIGSFISSAAFFKCLGLDI